MVTFVASKIYIILFITLKPKFMKKYLLTAVLGLAGLAASAQAYVGGTVGAWRDNSEKMTQIAIMPEVGYNLNNKFAVGTTIGWEYRHKTDINTNLFQFNPYARYTFFKSGIVGIFCDGTVGFGVGKTSYKDYDSDTACTWQIGFKPGVSLALSDRFSVVAHLGLIGYKGANDAAKASGYHEEWGLHLTGNDLSFGFYYNF